MQVAFRVDASVRIGSGHVMRCMRLAQALYARGAAVRFICRLHEGHLCDLLRSNGFPVVELPQADAVSAPCRSDDAWLGARAVDDAAQTAAALGGSPPDWLVVDHYALDAAWERALRPCTRALMVIDDLADRSHDCDLLLDQNLVTAATGRRAGLLPRHGVSLLGPRFALLAPQFAERRRDMRRRQGDAQRVMVFFGGADLGGLTAMAIEALCDRRCAHLQVDVVVGAMNPRRAQIEAQVAARPLTRLHGPVPHLADLMVDADLAIGAGGSTTWERMCLGLPSIVVAAAANQLPGCEAAAAQGLIDYAGPAAQVTSAHLRSRILSCLSQPLLMQRWSDGGQLRVDGLGAARVSEALMPTPLSGLHLRPAQPHDEVHYHEWANEPEVRRQSVHTGMITWDEHQAWFKARLADPCSHLFVMLAGELPIGQIRFEREGNQARLNYSLDPLVRGRGWGARMVALGLHHLGQHGPLRVLALVKPDNMASSAVFQRLGFEELPFMAESQLRAFSVLVPDGR